MTSSNPKFNVGKITITLFAQLALERSGQNADEFLEKHKKGIWGEITKEETEENEKTVISKNRNGKKIISSYVTSFNEYIWFITDFSENKTIVLLPGEYERFFENGK